QGPGLYLPEPQIKNLAAPMVMVTTEPRTLQLEVAELPAPQPLPQPPLEGSGDMSEGGGEEQMLPTGDNEDSE
ncbi:MAG: hypothetical protein ACJAYU_003097, partial [Bradymonadia bacterium]